MKTLMTTLVAGLAISIALGSENKAQAQDFRSLVSGAVNSIQKHSGSIQSRSGFVGRQASSKHFGGGHGHWNPRPDHCPPTYCPPTYCPPTYCPPPPRVCYIYLVYYYDCHCGWKLYGEYHNRYAASQAVSQLQHQGYRAYMQQAAR